MRGAEPIWVIVMAFLFSVQPGWALIWTATSAFTLGLALEIYRQQVMAPMTPTGVPWFVYPGWAEIPSFVRTYR